MARTTKSESPEPSPVRLKPILGIKPESYVPVILGLGLLLVLFFLLLYPGLRSYGSEVTVRSTPAGSEVVVDGVRLGATPLTSFVGAGEHELSITYPGFEPEQRSVQISGRLFGTLVAPRQQEITVTLTPLSPEALATNRAEAFARWALAGAGSAAFQVPPFLAETSRALGSFPLTPDALTSGRRLLATARYHLASPAQLKDLARGTLLMNGFGGVTQLSVARSVLELIQPATNSQESAALQALLRRALPAPMGERFRGGIWYDESRSVPPVELSTGGELPTSFSLGGIGFRRTPGGALMMEREVTREDYAGFLVDTPGWRPENLQELLEAGSVTEDYLADWAMPRSSEEPIRYVSWHAASAFANWMTQRLYEAYPSYRGEFVIRLPREEEWRDAATAEPVPGSGENALERIAFEAEGETPYPIAPERRSESGFYDLYGNLWEWSADWYTPSPEARFLDSSAEPQIAGAERIVQGGSFANSLRDLAGELRGSQPPAWCSPYLGFRLVLAAEEEL